jgi:carbon-monoxide dehydrogenase small subunit
LVVRKAPFGVSLYMKGKEERVRRIQVRVNGSTYEHEVEPRLLLVHYLREVLNLTGTMVGCNTSNCGACTVLMEGESVKSCTVFAVQADGHEITTVQGLAENGNWHPMQTAFHENHALQCGYCTPGMIMASVSLLNEKPDPSEEEIREALEGNYCRCTGYENIIQAVQQAAGQMSQASS